MMLNRNRMQSGSSEQCQWMATETLSVPSKYFHACEKEILFFDNMFAVINNVTLQNSRNSNSKKGDFTLALLYNSNHCKNQVDLRGLHLKGSILSWMKTIQPSNETIYNKTLSSQRIGFLASRHDVNNLYHTMTLIYNIVVAKILLHVTHNITVVIFVDTHQEKTILQELWETLFQEVVHIKKATATLHFGTLIMVNSGYDGYLSHFQLPRLPFISEFTQFVANKFRICNNKKLNCSSINILIILRQDGRNEDGSVKVTERKFYNERKLLSEIKKSLPAHRVRGVRLESFPIRTQFSFISQTDFLVGMHGAGMTYALFLPEHAGVLELFNANRDTGNLNYRTISKWRKLFYRAWQNYRVEDEFPNFETRFHARIIKYYFLEYIRFKCKN
ncbi:EGF domain-specific O-linked N-acetylglucosamine transferase-like [Saccostrea echinata]|uniref:EGF domain-specific O-linked N-acetylglucosamine transferase-like n=1 Tax=Saccostrea echinata TaxID=191078 RepID=UPI002A818EC4|nr:EGF domain-specific O-linked N-acetylglucosamine transferase-like [Saccostrea echinata]